MTGVLHPKCGQRFHGSHCAACCVSFSGQASFDAHRLGPASKYPWTCLPEWCLPALGLVKLVNGSWAGAGADPEGPTKRAERLRKRRCAS